MRITLGLVSISIFSRERRSNIRCGGQSMWVDHSGSMFLLCTYLVILSCCGQSMRITLGLNFYFIVKKLLLSEFGSNMKLWWSIYVDH